MEKVSFDEKPNMAYVGDDAGVREMALPEFEPIEPPSQPRAVEMRPARNVRREKPTKSIAFQDQDPNELPYRPTNPGTARRSQLYSNPLRPASMFMPEAEPRDKTLFEKYGPSGFLKERTVTTLGWLLLVLAALAWVLTLVMFVAPGWGWTLEIRGFDGVFEGQMYGEYGLWFVCWSLTEDTPDTKRNCQLVQELSFVPSWFKGCQAMGILTLIAALATLTAAVSYVCFKSINRNPICITLIVILAIASALFSLVLFILFCIQFLQEAYWCCPSGAMQIVEWNLNYCFIIGIVVPCLFFCIAVLGAVEVNSLKQRERMERYLERVESTRFSGAFPGKAPYPGGHYQPHY